MSDSEPIEFIEDKSEDFINHLIRHSESIEGSLRIDVKDDESFDIVIHKGTEVEVNKVRNVSKDKLLELLSKRL